MNQARKRTGTKKVLSMILVLVMLLSLLSMAAFTLPASETGNSKDSYEYNIMFLDCGRKYYSVDSIKQIIDNASAAGFNYIQLAVGNDGLRFLLDDMSLKVNGTTYGSDAVKNAVQAGNLKYNQTQRSPSYNPTTNELTQSEMDKIIAYAQTNGMGVIPCVNTPGHMDAILSAATSLTGTNCSYRDSVRTIDVTNTTAVAFTKALLQKYITYFADKGCKLFNMGADEYANDKFTGGSMGFGNLQSSGKYSSYVDYVNAVDNMIQAAGMTAMAFNDGIYFNSNTDSGTFNTDIVVCYWSSGWSGYSPMPAKTLADKGFRLINTNGDYYWVLGKSNAQCDANKARGFDKTSFPGSTVNNPAGSMFCIWADYPGAESEADVISKTADTIAAFGKTLPAVKKVETVESKTVTNGDVAVTAPGLTDLTVTATTAPTIDTAAEGKVSAYDVTPATKNGSYAGSGSVSLPVPEGWDASRVRGYIVNEDRSVTTGLTGTTANGKFTFTVPHFSKMGIYELAANAATETKTINLTVGGTTTDTIDGEYPGTKLDDAVASVVGGEPTDKPGTTTYEPATLGEGTFYVSTTANDTAPTVQLTFEDAGNGQYYIKNSDGKYLYPTADHSWLWGWDYSVTTTTKNEDAAVKVETNNDGSIVISKTVTSGWSSTTAYLTLSGKSFGAAENGTSLYLYQQQTTPGGKETTLTFTGKSIGTTKVTIGDTQYIIKVTDEVLSTVTPLTVEYWITNKRVTADGATSKQIKADPSVHSETGAKFSDLVPAEGTQDNNTDVLWKGTRLTSSNKQTTDGGNDQTRAGNDFAYIRYWNQKWSFSADGKSWMDFNADDQIVAYYLQKTDVTSEITTNVVDWGQPYSEWKAGGGNNGWFWDGYVENGSKYVFLDFAVVYEDNTQNPSSFPTDKTLFYHFDGCSETNPRVLGAINFTENSDYEIWKVTVTDGTSTGYSSYSTFAPTYDNTTETTVWDESMGGIPQIDQLKYTANRSGKLVRVYVRAKVTEDSLTVNYFDENNTSLPFYSYNIAVASGTTFNEGFAYSNGALINNTVENIKGVTQTVNWQLEKMPEIGAQYRFGNYTFTSAAKESGNKVVNLYYRFNSEKTFVVDFGLPLHITKTDISPELSQANIQGVAVGNSLYATVRANDDYSIDYILNKTIDGSDRITVTYTGTNASGVSDSATYNLTIIPATSVYYEDSFASFTDGTGKADDATWSIVGNDGNVTADKSTSQKQALTELGKMDADAVYGHDAAYANSTKLSMGSAHKVTVNANMVKDWSDGSAWPSATFTFKGTGFDVISLTDNTSGTIFVTVTNKKTGQIEKRTTVNNYYGYKLENGKWVASPNDPNCLYQIPVIKIAGLDYAEYEVKIQVAYADFLDEAKAGNYSFWLDAIRVYDPMGKNNVTYTQDDEGYPQYIKLHDAIVRQTADIQNTVFVDGGANATLDEYTNHGPNNEVYLMSGQAISFRLTGNLDSIASVQIGAKTPNGTGEAAKISVNGQDVKTATEMYYAITKYAKDGQQVTIANNGSGILSLTNLKITYTASGKSVSLAALTTADQENAVAQVRALFAAPAEPFQPERFEASWGRAVRKGNTATLTVKASEDVDSITVDDQAITTYDTKTERTGWGWWAKTVTYREFTYQVAAEETTDYTICAVNSAGVSSDPITATLTVRPSVRDWWHGIFDKWF